MIFGINCRDQVIRFYLIVKDRFRYEFVSSCYIACSCQEKMHCIL